MYRRPRREGLFLQNEILGKKVIRRIHICIDGREESGKSTLATRFRDIDQGPYSEFFEVRKKNKYVIPINLSHRPNVKKRGRVMLHIYIEPNPNMREWFPIWLDSKLSSFVVFCFDVNDIDTFRETKERIIMYIKNLRENLPTYIIVGNKIDIRDHPDRDSNENIVTTEFGQLKAKKWLVNRYFECSAWENRGVGRVLDYILNVTV